MSELINNRDHRIRTMKEIIQHLHQGGSADEVRARLRALVGETDASEIAAMEQQLMAEGMPVAEVQSMCDLHSSVLREILVAPPAPAVPPGHPVDTFRRENAALAEAVGKLRAAMAEVARPTDEPVPAAALTPWKKAYNDLMDVEKHYQRKEQLLFSCLERHGVTGPSKVMWGKDDEVRGLLKSLGEALAAGEATAAQWAIVAEAVAEPALAAVEEMISKEERILLPMALTTLTEEEWGEIWQQTPRYGYCLVDPQQGYAPPASTDPEAIARVGTNESLIFPTGALTAAQIRGIFGALPVDLTFTDADDRVRFFSESPGRGFDRSKAILGRKVQHCHPPKSVHTVEQILDDFKSGRQSVAEFWINFHGGVVHIRYFAVRDEAGAYLGTLEVTQDITPIQALEGERRLLQYADAKGGAA